MPKKPKMDAVQNAVDIARTVTDDNYKSKLKRPRESHKIQVRKDEPRMVRHPGFETAEGLPLSPIP